MSDAIGVMGVSVSYKVVKPCAFAVDGVAKQPAVGSVVDVPEDQAELLVAQGKLEPVEPKPKRKAKVEIEIGDGKAEEDGTP